MLRAAAATRCAATAARPRLPRWGRCAAAAGACVAAAGVGGGLLRPPPASCATTQDFQPKQNGEAAQIEALQRVILDSIESRLDAIESRSAEPPAAPPAAAAAAPAPKRRPAAPPPAATAANPHGLAGRRILVTAPSNYAARLAAQVMARGGRPICMPTIVTEPLADAEHAALDDSLRQLDAAGPGSPAFSYIAFTSRNGIEAFVRRAKALGLAGDLPALLEGVTVCALGNDAKLLEEAGIEVGLLPEVSSPSGIIAELRTRGECVPCAPATTPTVGS